jgi:hydroxymethylglutaryl-CoA reductase
MIMCTQKTSRLSGFYKQTHDQRLALLGHFAELSEQEINLLKNIKALDFQSANRMIENVVSMMQVPLGIATNFLINGNDYLIPMAIEEPSVVAAASNAARLARESGGFWSVSSAPFMIGQIILTNVYDFCDVYKIIEKHKEEILLRANACDPVLVALGGGARDVCVDIHETAKGHMVTCQLIVDVQDAMGANVVNTMAETIAPVLEKLTGGTVFLRIVSNLSIQRMTQAWATWKKEIIGDSVIEKILDAYAYAHADHFRCATHNKGIMNGIDAVALATGNDFRALEAGAHAYASYQRNYSPLTHYYRNSDGDLVGEIRLPLAVGIVGGITQSHPLAQLCLKILDVKSSCELANILASVGLAQNFAALKALVTDGIQAGHMRLHSKNIAIMAGVPMDNVDHIAGCMCEEKNISVKRARELMESR